jgi:hypothetical protein
LLLKTSLTTTFSESVSLSFDGGDGDGVSAKTQPVVKTATISITNFFTEIPNFLFAQKSGVSERL